MSLLLFVAGTFLPMIEGPEIRVPRVWMLGKERSTCSVREGDVRKLLGSPDSSSASAWIEHWYYSSLGLRFTWERPAVLFCPAERIGPQGMKLLFEAAPIQARPIVWLAKIRVTPRESLLDVSWFVFDFEMTFRFERP